MYLVGMEIQVSFENGWSDLGINDLYNKRNEQTQINPESDCRKIIKILRLEAYIKTSAETCAFNYAIQCSSLGMQTFPVVGSLASSKK